MKLIESYEFNEPGYKKIFSYQEWRIAMLNYIDNLEIEAINYIECHNKTDEVFILLTGSCTMILLDENQEFHFANLEPNKIYNIPKGVYHNHVLTEGSKVLIVEQEDTSDANSHRIYLDELAITKLRDGWKSREL